MRIIVVLLISSMLFIKCNAPSFNKELKSLDSLKMSLAESKEELKKIDTNIIDNNFKTFISNMNLVEKINQKKVNDSIRIIADEYRMLGGDFFKKYKMQMMNFLNELGKSENQLENLKNDLSNGRIPKSTFDGYYKMEKERAEKINEEIEMYSKITTNKIKKFEELNPKIEKIIKKK